MTMLTFFRPMGGAARILPKTRFIGGVFCYARGVVLRGFRIGACHIGRVSCCTQCVDPFGGNDSACMYGVFVHGAIVSKDARFVYGLLRPKFRVSRDPSVPLGQRGCVWGRFAVVSSFRGQRGSVWGKSQTVHRPKSAVRGAWKGRCGTFSEKVKARFTKSQVRRLRIVGLFCIVLPLFSIFTPFDHGRLATSFVFPILMLFGQDSRTVRRRDVPCRALRHMCGMARDAGA